MSSTSNSQSNLSRQQRRVQFLTNNPEGPRMRRLDLLLPRETYEQFEAIMNNTNQRRREAMVSMIETRYEQMVAEGIIEPSDETPQA